VRIRPAGAQLQKTRNTAASAAKMRKERWRSRATARIRVARCPSGNPSNRFSSSSLRWCERFEAGDDVEQLLVDAALAQAMECPVEVLQQFVDVFFGALHGRQAACVLARERFHASPEERDEKILTNERPQGRGAAWRWADFGKSMDALKRLLNAPPPAGVRQITNPVR